MILATAGVVDPDRETARRLAVEELSRAEYARAQPGLLQRVAGAVLDWLDGLLSQAGTVSSGTALVIGVVLLGLLLAVVVLAVLLAGPLGRTRRGNRRAAGVFGDTTRSAAEHRALGAAEAAAGRWGPAVQESFRAAARTLEERVVLDARPGRTADEVAREGGAELPGAAEALRRAAAVFDDVTYGERPGTREGYEACLAADAAAQQQRPRRPQVGGPTGPVPVAVP